MRQLGKSRSMRDLSLSALGFSPPRSGGAPSAGQDGPLLYPGPLCGGEAGTTGRVAGIDKDVDAFSPGQDALAKSPAPAHGLAAHGWAASAKRGGLSLWLSFSLATQRESNSGAEGARKPLIVFTQRSQYTREGGHNEINHPHARAPPPW